MRGREPNPHALCRARNFKSLFCNSCPLRFSLKQPTTEIGSNDPIAWRARTDSGKQITQLESVPSIDGLWYDATHKRVHATGDGAIAVYDQKDADHYTPMVKVASEPNLEPSIWVPEFKRLYVSVHQNGKQEAEVLVYQSQR